MERAALRDRVARAKLERDEQNRPVGVRNPAYVHVRYATAEERQAARRRSWNESKKRLYGVCPKCRGHKAASPSVQMCRSCWSKVRVGLLER